MTRAYFTAEGQLVDPDAIAVARAVGKHNCRVTLANNAERVQHFKRRMETLGHSPADWVIVVLSVDDSHGGPIADLLMPNHDWQSIRNAGQVPFARGMVSRAQMTDIVAMFDPDAADKLRTLTGVVVLVVDYDVAEVFEA